MAKEQLTIDDILEAMWASVADRFKISDRRHLMAKWKRLFKKTGITPRKYLAIMHVGAQHWFIESESRPGQLHAVDLDTQECSCEACQFNNGRACKHIFLLQGLDKKGLLPTNVTWRMKDQCTKDK